MFNLTFLVKLCRVNWNIKKIKIKYQKIIKYICGGYIFPLLVCAQIKRIGKIFSSDFSWIIKLLFSCILKLVKQIFKIYELIFLILIFNFHRQECSLNIVFFSGMKNVYVRIWRKGNPRNNIFHFTLTYIW